MDYSAISGFMLLRSRRRSIHILCLTAIRYFLSLDLFASMDLFVTMKLLKRNTGPLLKRDVSNGFVKTKHCSKKRLLSGKPHNKALQTDERRANVRFHAGVTLAPPAAERQNRYADSIVRDPG